VSDTTTIETRFLKNLWDDQEAEKLKNSPLELLRYRSNLLGADLRITNFGGGNTSSKFDLSDPLTGEPQRVMAVKGSGGDLRSMGTSGFAILYLDKLERLIARYRGEEFEDEMVAMYPLCAFGENRVAASIDTPLHAFLPYDHVDHLHPDWAIALAASANGHAKLEEFNKKYGRKIIWVPWQRPGFELALMLKRSVETNPGADGLILGGHGLFTWGTTQKECYLNSVRTIDQMGEFVQVHRERSGAPLFGGVKVTGTVADREAAVIQLFPALRGAVSSNRRVIGHFDGSEDALTFAEPPRQEVPRGLSSNGRTAPSIHCGSRRGADSRDDRGRRGAGRPRRQPRQSNHRIQRMARMASVGGCTEAGHLREGRSRRQAQVLRRLRLIARRDVARKPRRQHPDAKRHDGCSCRRVEAGDHRAQRQLGGQRRDRLRRSDHVGE